MATVGATIAHRLSLEYSSAKAAATTPAIGSASAQRFAKVRYDQPLAFGSAWGGVESGKRSASSTLGLYHLLTFGATISATAASLSFFGELYDGGAVTHGAAGHTTLGGSAIVRLHGSNSLTLLGYRSSYRSVGSTQYSQLDARLTHELTRGSSISIRGRYSSSMSAGVSPQKLVYLEYGLPLRLPVGHLRVPGRVSGRVVDEAGKGVKGALVRVGSLAGVTDGGGLVTVAGLYPGEYRVSLAGDASISNAALIGNPVVRIDSLRREAPRFLIALSPASKIRGTVRQFASAKTSLGGGADSLVDNGPVGGVTLALVGQRDTVYRTSGADGKFVFDQIPGGKWTIAVEDEAPSSFSYERRRVELVARAGSDAEVDFRLVPRQKRVQIIAGNVSSAAALSIPEANRK